MQKTLIYIYNVISDTYNNTFQLAALKVFSQLGKFIEKHEKLNKNNVYELPNDIVSKINTSNPFFFHFFFKKARMGHKYKIRIEKRFM